MTTHSSILAQRIPWAEEPGGLQSMGLQTVRHDCAINTHTDTHTDTHAHTHYKVLNLLFSHSSQFILTFIYSLLKTNKMHDFFATQGIHVHYMKTESFK